MSFVAFNLSYYNVINIPKFCMLNIQPTIVKSSSCVNTPSCPCSVNLVLQTRWFDKDVRGIFQVWLAFCNDMKPFSITSTISSKASIVHLPLIILFVLTTYNIYHLSLPKFMGEHCKLQQILASYPLILKVHNHSPQESNEMSWYIAQINLRNYYIKLISFMKIVSCLKFLK